MSTEMAIERDPERSFVDTASAAGAAAGAVPAAAAVPAAVPAAAAAAAAGAVPAAAAVPGAVPAAAAAAAAAPAAAAAAATAAAAAAATTAAAAAAAASVALVEVAVLLPVPGTYHYIATPALASRANVGARVLVEFGRRKVSGVIVRGAAELAAAGVSAAVAPKPLVEILDDAEPALSPELVALCAWIADYYEAPLGEVLRAALPAGTHIATAAVVEVTPAGLAALAGDGAVLPPRQRDLLATIARADRLAPSTLTAKQRTELVALVTAGLADHVENRSEPRAKLARRRVARLADGVDVERATAETARAPRRRAIVEALAAGERDATLLAGEIKGAGSALRDLVKAGLVVVESRAVEAGPVAAPSLPAAVTPPTLTAEQAAAHTALSGALGGGFTAALLHGVTGSGKTEVYLHVIADALARGDNAIVLVPEISLTPQLAARFAARFGDQVAVLHSGLSDRDRLGEWRRLRHGKARIALGARSAVFAPLANVGVIVVDEEHDGSFKQDEGVRYHARDVALVRAQRAGAVCVLGSATPSLETAHAARAGRYQLHELTQRPTASPLPAVEIVDLRTYMPDGDAMLSAPLAAAIGDALAAGDQIILFLNRRGFATFVLCVACGQSFRCKSCSVSLTYHQHQDRLLCHYCGFSQRVPEACPACAAVGAIERKGLGTEKIAAAVAERFPTARVARLDRDVASGARIEPILARVARREIDILVGTQMVTKGHDFPGVTLVGVLCADTGLSLPDFRASERTYQLLSQVAGRAGRGDRPGKVIIQTYRPREPAVICAAVHDYAAFYAAELEARAELGYPPHGRLVAIRIDGPAPAEVAETARRLAQLAEQAARGSTVEVRGPVPAPLARLRNRTRWQLWLRGPDRAALRRIVRGLRGIETASAVRIAVDVDPLSTL
jgi:primosomal protein N' (replication factor Y) (superfamily II helicase)